MDKVVAMRVVAMRMSRTVAGALALAASVALSVCGACEKTRKPVRYELQEGFTGWAIVVYGRSGYPKLPLVDGHYIVRLGGDGALVTSTSMQTGWAHDRFFYVRGPAENPREIPDSAIHAASTGIYRGPSGMPMDYMTFYIGANPKTDAEIVDQMVREWYRKLVESQQNGSRTGK